MRIEFFSVLRDVCLVLRVTLLWLRGEFLVLSDAFLVLRGAFFGTERRTFGAERGISGSKRGTIGAENEIFWYREGYFRCLEGQCGAKWGILFCCVGYVGGTKKYNRCVLKKYQHVSSDNS